MMCAYDAFTTYTTSSADDRVGSLWSTRSEPANFFCFEYPEIPDATAKKVLTSDRCKVICLYSAGNYGGCLSCDLSKTSVV